MIQNSNFFSVLEKQGKEEVYLFRGIYYSSNVVALFFKIKEKFELGTQRKYYGVLESYGMPDKTAKEISFANKECGFRDKVKITFIPIDDKVTDKFKLKRDRTDHTSLMIMFELM